MQSGKRRLHRQRHGIPIGKSLIWSPSFPPVHTGHAPFSASGVPPIFESDQYDNLPQNTYWYRMESVFPDIPPPVLPNPAWGHSSLPITGSSQVRPLLFSTSSMAYFSSSIYQFSWPDTFPRTNDPICTYIPLGAWLWSCQPDSACNTIWSFITKIFTWPHWRCFRILTGFPVSFIWILFFAGSSAV